MSASTVQESLVLINSASIYCCICDETRQEHTPWINPMMQMLHQVSGMKSSLAIYVASAETVVLCTVFMCVNVEIRDEVLRALNPESARVVR